jgi:hypothetical protein
MSSEKPTTVYTEKLTSKNRINWAIRAKNEIVKAKVGSTLSTPRDATNVASCDKHEQACAVLCGLLTDHDLELLEKHKDVRDLLKALEDRYKGIAEVHAASLWNDFHSTKMTPTTTFRAYVTQLKGVVEALKNCNQAVADANAVAVALAGLPSSWDQYTAPYHSNKSLMPKTLEEFEQNLMGVEAHLERRASTHQRSARRSLCWTRWGQREQGRRPRRRRPRRRR